MKKVLCLLMFSTLIVSMVMVTHVVADSAEYSITINDDNRVVVMGAEDGVVFIAQYDENKRLIWIEVSYADLFTPDIRDDTVYLKAFLWDSMETMNNLAQPAEKELNHAQRHTINYRDIKSFKMASTYSILEYYTDEKRLETNEVILKREAEYIVNGDASHTQRWLSKCVANGYYITFTIPDARIDLYCVTPSPEYDYDRVKVTIYEDFIVDNYDQYGTNQVYAHETSPMSLSAIDMQGDDYTVSIKDIYGNTISASQLNKFDVLAMSVTPFDWEDGADIKHIEAVLNPSTRKGIITDINTDDKEIYVDGKKYHANDKSIYMPKVGDKGVCGFNIHSQIIIYNRVTAKEKYAVITKGVVNKNNDNPYGVEMYTSDGELVTKEFADEVVLHECISIGTFRDIITAREAYDRSCYVTPVGCTYELNESGQISMISFSHEELETTKKTIKSTALVAGELRKSCTISGGTTRALVVINKENDAYYLNEDTKIIVMDPEAYSDGITEDDFCVYRYDDFDLNVKAVLCIYIYDVDANSNAGFAFIRDSSFLKTDTK